MRATLRFSPRAELRPCQPRESGAFGPKDAKVAFGSTPAGAKAEDCEDAELWVDRVASW